MTTFCTVDGCDRPKRATNGMCGMHYQRWSKKGSTELRTRYATCTVDGCERAADRVTIGLCEAHYMQQRRNGVITSVEVRPRQGGPRNPAAQVSLKPTTCKEDGCGNPVANRGWCTMHYTRWLRHGDPSARLPTVAEMPAPIGADHPGWLGDNVGYGAVHGRIRARRGSASGYSCQHCGNQAAHWAYDHGDLAEQADPKYGPYSTDLNHYIALCVPCHKRFDLDHLAGHPLVAVS